MHSATGIASAAGAFGIEGRFRDLSPAEVLQLIAGGRKTGTLHCDTAWLGQRARVTFRDGFVVGVEVQREGENPLQKYTQPPANRELNQDQRDGASEAEGKLKGEHPHLSEPERLAELLQDVIRWRDGSFRFAPDDLQAAEGTLRMAIEPILIRAAERAEVWSRIGSRVPHLGVVPGFADMEPQNLPLLRLSPGEWELLAQVDGERDLHGLALALGIDPVEVAARVAELLDAGLLVLRHSRQSVRRDFAPVTPELPEEPEGYALDDVFSVATPAPEPSLPGGETETWGEPVTLSYHEYPECDELGDACALRGDLTGAIEHWQRALDRTRSAEDMQQLGEKISLASRLARLLLL